MAAGFRANALGGNSQTGATASLTVVIPPEASAGDAARLAVVSSNDTVNLNTPTNWLLLSGPTGTPGPDRVGTLTSGWLYVGIVGTGPGQIGAPGATVTLTFSTPQRCSAHMTTYSGVTLTGLSLVKRIEAAAVPSTTLPSVGSVPAGAVVDVSWSRRFGGTPAPNVAAPAVYAQGSNARTATAYGSVPELSVEGAYRITATAGTYGGETATVSSNSVGVNYLLVLPVIASGDITIAGATAVASATAPAGTYSAGSTRIVGVPALATASAVGGSVAGGTVPIDPPVLQWPPEPYREAIRNGLVTYYTVDASYGGQPVRDASGLRPTGGSITQTTRPGVGRQLSLNLPDASGELFTRITPAGTRLTVTAHLRYTDRTEQTLPMGVFVVDDTNLSETTGELSITAPDKWATIQRARFLKPQASSRGALVVNQIASLIRGALGQSEAVIISATSGAQVGALTWEQDRDQAIIDLAAQIGAWVFFDRDGVANIADQPRVGAVAKWLIDASASGVLTDIDRSLSRADAANVVVVESSASDEGKFDTVVVWDSDPDSLTYAGPDPVNQPGAAGPFGIVVVHVSSPNLTTAEQARDFGGAELARRRGLVSQVSLEEVPNPALDAFDVFDVLPPGQQIVGVDDDGAPIYRSTRQIERHIADTVTHPLLRGPAQRIEGRATSLIDVVSPPDPPDPPDPPPPPVSSTIFGYNTAENGTAAQTLAGRQSWWGRAPMVRRYHTGMLPASFAQGTPVAPERRVCLSFQAEGSGTFTLSGLIAGAGNSRITTWAESIPANTYVMLMFRHEANLHIPDSLTGAQFVSVCGQVRAAINAATLNAGVTLKLVANFSAYQLTGSTWSDTWIPSASVIDVLTFDVYGNPGVNTSATGTNRYGTATGTGYGTTYPLPEVRFQPMFDIIRRTGWAQHWGILEINSPARSWDTNETARARWFTDAYNLLLAQSYDPEVVLLWEQVGQSFANWDQSFGRVSGSPTPVVNALAPYIQGSP